MSIAVIDYGSGNLRSAAKALEVAVSNANINEKIIVSSTGALSFEKVPKELIIIGGGYIGLEMGSVWSRLGSKVRVVEFSDKIIPEMDKDISNEFLKILSKQGINFDLDSY